MDEGGIVVVELKRKKQIEGLCRERTVERK